MNLDKQSGTPPGTPSRLKCHKRKQNKSSKRKARSSLASSSSSSGASRPRKSHKLSTKLSTRYVLELLTSINGDSRKNAFFGNNLNNVVPEYDPSNRSQTMDCWLRKVNECAIIYGWDDKQTIHFSLQKLVGLANKWFEALPTVVHSWSEWQLKLRKAFPSEENYGRLLEEMLGRNLLANESLREYFYEKLALLNRCEISGKKAVDCIIHGINDRSIQNGAQALSCDEPEDLLNFLSSQKILSVSNSKYKDWSSHKHNFDKSGDPGTNSFNTYNSAVVCYNCNEKGHPYYRCSKPLLKCRCCNRVGHDDENCKIKSTNNNNSRSNNS